MEMQQRRLREASNRLGATSRGPHYSREKRYKRRREAETGLREMLVQQCIVSGLILFVALMISFLPLGFAIELRSGVKRALSQEGDADGLIDVAGGITNRYESLKDSIRSIFEGPSDGVSDQWPTGDIPADIYSPTERGIPQDSAARAVQTDTEVRIDENVLSIINTGGFYEVDDSEKKR